MSLLEQKCSFNLKVVFILEQYDSIACFQSKASNLFFQRLALEPENPEAVILRAVIEVAIDLQHTSAPRRALAYSGLPRSLPLRPRRLMQLSRLMQRSQSLDIMPLFLSTSPLHNSGMIYGCARVSTDGQSVAAQVAALAEAGASKVFRETASGAKTDRTQLRRSVELLERGDVLLVTRLDRLKSRSHYPSRRLWLVEKPGHAFSMEFQLHRR